MKKILISICAIIIISIIAFAGLYFFIKPNQYKKDIAQAFYNLTGRTLIINGDIKLNLFPYINLQINNAEVTNPPGLVTGNTIEIDKINIAVELKPLFKQQLNINHLNIDGLRLNLIKSNESFNNWQFSHFQQNLTKIKQDAFNSSSQEHKHQLHFDLRSLILTNATISYSNLTNHTHYLLSNVHVQLQNLQNNSFSINGNQIVINNLIFQLNNLKNAQLNIIINNFNNNNLKYSGNINIPGFSLNKFTQQLKINLPTVANQKIFDNFAISSNFFGNKNSISLNTLNVLLNNSHITGCIDIHNFAPLTVSNIIKIDKLETTDLVDLSGYRLPLTNIEVKGQYLNKPVSALNTQMQMHQSIKITNIILHGFSLEQTLNKLYGIIHLNIDKFPQQIDPLSLINNIKTTFEPIRAKKVVRALETDLGQLNSTIDINNNNLKQIISLNGQYLRSNANGKLDLQTKVLNYNALIKFKYANPNDSINKLILPLHVDGALPNIRSQVDWANVAEQIITQQTQFLYNKNTKTPINKTIDNLKKSADSLINNLFK